MGDTDHLRRPSVVRKTIKSLFTRKPKFPFFLRLPPEIRNMVYRSLFGDNPIVIINPSISPSDSSLYNFYACEKMDERRRLALPVVRRTHHDGRKTYHYCSHDTSYPVIPGPWIGNQRICYTVETAVLRVNRQIYNEASAVLYGEFEFRVESHVAWGLVANSIRINHLEMLKCLHMSSKMLDDVTRRFIPPSDPGFDQLRHSDKRPDDPDYALIEFWETLASRMPNLRELRVYKDDEDAQFSSWLETLLEYREENPAAVDPSQRPPRDFLCKIDLSSLRPHFEWMLPQTRVMEERS